MKAKYENVDATSDRSEARHERGDIAAGEQLTNKHVSRLKFTGV